VTGCYHILTSLQTGMRVPAAAVIEDLWEESSLKDALRMLAEERAEARGEARGMRELIEMVLASRFVLPGEDVPAALAAATLLTLKALSEHVAIDSLAGIRQRLGLD
jgi:hypothetical protein